MHPDQDPPRTGFELRWRMLGVGVRVFPSFFFITALIVGIVVYMQMIKPANLLDLAIIVAIDVACVFVAILFIGMVQGWVYRSYGIRSTVVVRELVGGISPEALPPTALQRIVVALAYPASSFLLFAIVYYSNLEYDWKSTSVIAQMTYFILSAISLFWGVIGLLPIYPYSGGRVMLEVFQFISPGYGLMGTLLVSILVGMAYVAYTAAVYFRHMKEVIVEGVPLPAAPIVAIFFALSVMQNWQLFQIVRAQGRPTSAYDEHDDDRRPWGR